MKIIDNVSKLISLTDEELNEKLCEKKYNKANLRELVRRLIKKTKEQQEEIENYKEKEISDKLIKLSLSNMECCVDRIKKYI